MESEITGKLYSNDEITIIGLEKNIIIAIFKESDIVYTLDLDTIEDFRFFKFISGKFNIDPIDRATIVYKSCFLYD